MNLFLDDLVALYSKSIRFLAGTHFAFDLKKNCFVCKEKFDYDSFFPSLSNVVHNVKGYKSFPDPRTNRMNGIGLNDVVTIGGEYHSNSRLGAIKLMQYRWCLTVGDKKLVLGTRLNKIAVDQDADYSTTRWLPVVSCVGCNCDNGCHSPLVLDMIYMSIFEN